jgi:hypothetical protein
VWTLITVVVSGPASGAILFLVLKLTPRLRRAWRSIRIDYRVVFHARIGNTEVTLRLEQGERKETEGPEHEVEAKMDP